MEAVILAGGFGTRLSSVVNDVPKPMAPVNGKPFLYYLLKYLRRFNFTKIVLALGYLYEEIINYFGYDFEGIELVYSVEEEPLGTGGSVKKALKLLKESYVFVINGDTYFEIDYNSINTNKELLIVCKYLSDLCRYGSLIINDDRIIEFKEKNNDGFGYINGGVYLLKKDIFDKFNMPNKFSLEKDFFQRYVKKIYIDSYIENGYFIDIGIPKDYYQFIEDFSFE